jgi:hypothetical protein
VAVHRPNQDHGTPIRRALEFELGIGVTPPIGEVKLGEIHGLGLSLTNQESIQHSCDFGIYIMAPALTRMHLHDLAQILEQRVVDLMFTAEPLD